MRKKHLLFISITSLLLVASCGTSRSTLSTLPNAVLYQNAVSSAMAPDEAKVYRKLLPISKQNKDLITKTFDGEAYILMVSWKTDTSYYNKYLDSAFYPTGKYEIWVTAAPQLLEFMNREVTTDVDMRIRQLLGLPPNAPNKFFIEFWVRPQDLFRPCPDNQVTDTSCDLCFPEAADATYRSWIDGNRISRYYACDVDDKYPWTQLGYTYDWNPGNKTHIGLSEFVIKPYVNIKVESILNTKAYLEQEKDN